MQLLYLWVQHYKNMHYSCPGLNFNPKYTIEFNKEKTNLEIKENTYIPNFFGEKVKEVTAIVGENGCGKSTTAEMIVDYSSYLPTINKDKDSNFIQIYLVEDTLWIYYYLSGKRLTHTGSEKVTKCYDVSRLNDKSYDSPRYEEEFKNIDITTIYLSNVFDPMHFIKFSNSSEETKSKRLYYSPAFALGINRLLIRDEFLGDSLTFAFMKEYADKMINSQNIFNDYLSYQSLLFIRCYKSAPETIKKELDIFKNFTLDVQEFGSYFNSKDITAPTKVSELDSSVHYIISLTQSLRNLSKNSYLMNCFLNILCEANTFFKHSSEKFEFKPLILEYIRKENPEIDISLLETIHTKLSANDNYKELYWVKQLKNSIDVFKKYSIYNFELGEFKFEDATDFLNFYMEQLESKTPSFFTKYTIFKPIPASTGEVALTNLFAYINDAFSKDKCKNVLLIIDELDVNLHPRWQQMILDSLINYLNELKSEKSIQLIFTSHSPIMLSDMTKDRVIMLRREDKNISVLNCTKPILGANILNLFYDNFFMDKGSIGELAKKKIKEVIEYNKNGDNNKDKIEYIIDNIGEPLVQQKLRYDFQLKNNSIESEIKKLIDKFGYAKTKNAIDLVRGNNND